jgi:hypothetical protein
MRILSANKRDITNPDFYLLMQRIQRRQTEAKMSRFIQDSGAKHERTTKWKEIVKAILGIIATYITIMVLVGVMK